MYNFINFRFLKNKRENSIQYLCKKIFQIFPRSKYYFPRPKEKNDRFYLDDYLKDLMLGNKVDYFILYILLKNYDLKKNDENIYLLIFLLKDKWNIDYISDNKCSFYDDTKFYYKKLYNCLNFIKKGRTHIFISLIIMRRIFPIILSLIEYCIKNYSEGKKYIIKNNDINNIYNIKILTNEFENVWEIVRENDIFQELKNNKKKNVIIKNIIKEYLSALKKLMQRFSEFGK